MSSMAYILGGNWFGQVCVEIRPAVHSVSGVLWRNILQKPGSQMPSSHLTEHTLWMPWMSAWATGSSSMPLWEPSPFLPQPGEVSAQRMWVGPPWSVGTPSENMYFVSGIFYISTNMHADVCWQDQPYISIRDGSHPPGDSNHWHLGRQVAGHCQKLQDAYEHLHGAQMPSRYSTSTMQEQMTLWCTMLPWVSTTFIVILHLPIDNCTQSYTQNTSLNTSITKNGNKSGLTLLSTSRRIFGMKCTRGQNLLPPGTLYRYTPEIVKSWQATSTQWRVWIFRNIFSQQIYYIIN